MKTRIIVWDRPGTPHAEEVKQAVIEGYGIDMHIGDNVQVVGDWDAIKGLLTDPGENIEGVIIPLAGFRRTDVDRAQKYYPKTLFFHALHDNKFEQVHKFKEHEHPVVVVVGAGDAERRNNTSWGYGLEFWDWDFIYNFGSDQASFSLGFICGKMLKLKDRLTERYSPSSIKPAVPQGRAFETVQPVYSNRSRKIEIDWWTTRHIMRQTCLRDEPNRPKGMVGIWDIHNGYGRVDWKRGYFYADKYIRTIPKDPYIISLGDPGEIKAQLFGSVDIEMAEITGAVKYRLFRNGTKVAETEKRYVNDVLKVQGTYDYQYSGVDKLGNVTELSKPTRVKYFLQSGIKLTNQDD